MNRTILEKYRHKYGSLLAFLALELLLFTSLNLANFGMLFRYLSIIFALALFPLVLLQYKKEDWLNVGLVLLLPLAAYSLFMAFSPLYFILQTFIDNLAMILSFFSFVLIGIAMAYEQEFKIEKALATIFAGIAAVLAISLIYTMWRYTFFYVTRFTGQALYFDGEAYMISNEAKWLFGFEFKEVTTAFFVNNAIILAPLLLGLLFIPFKKISTFDYFWIVSGGIGLIAIIFLPYFSAIKFLIPAIIVALMVKFYPRDKRWLKILNYGLYVAMGIFSLAAVSLLLYAFEVPFFVNLVTNNAILNRVFGNSIVVSYAEVIQASINHPFGGLHPIIIGNRFMESTGSAVFDSLYQGGYFAAFGYLAFMGFSGYTLIRYYKNSQDAHHLKMLVILFALTYAVVSLFHYEYAPFVREGQRIYKLPHFSDLYSLLVVFLVGYAYVKSNKQLETKSEPVVVTSSPEEEVPLA